MAPLAGCPGFPVFDLIVMGRSLSGRYVVTEIEAALEALSRDPAISGLIATDAAIVVFDAKIDRILHASPRAASLAAAAGDTAGRIALDGAVRERLRALARGEGGSSGARLERVRFGPGASEPITLVCRPFSIDGSPALAALVLDPIATGDVPTGNAAPVTALLERIRRQGPRRFVWSLDSEGRFTSVSTPLAEVVGREHAAILGRRWDEIVGPHIVDPGGGVAEALREKTAWSDRTVFWRITDTAYAVPVELGGMPVLTADGDLLGFRGFGLCRTGEAGEIRDEPEPSLAAGEPAVAPPLSEPRTEALNDDVAGEGSHEAVAFESIHAQVGAQLGGPRLVAIRPAGDEVPAPDRPHLSVSERGALREIAKALGARLEADEERATAEPPRPAADVIPIGAGRKEVDALRIFDRLPVGILVVRAEAPLYANRFVLDLLGFRDRGELAASGGLSRLFAGRIQPRERRGDVAAPLVLLARTGENVAVEVRLITVDWADGPASLLMVRPAPDIGADPPPATLRVELARSKGRLAEARAILDRLPLAIVTLDAAGRMLALNRSAETLFGFAENEVAGETYATLLAPESHREAADLLMRARAGGGRMEAELIGRRRAGPGGPLALSIEGLPEDGAFLLVARDLAAERESRRDLDAARRAADAMGGRQSAVLARVNHEVRTPLNAILGFTEVMLEERFGPIGNERYRDYLRDIHASGGHIVSLVNDLLDLAKIEAGKAELSFTGVDIGEVAGGGISLLREAARNAKIVVRSALPPDLPRVIADERSMRQVVLNLVGNAVRFTKPGGQVIVSTAVTDEGAVRLSVRDTGIGMNAGELDAALEPFRQVGSAGVPGGTGLGLPLAKALAEANRTVFDIASEPGKGTLATVTFPPSRVLAG